MTSRIEQAVQALVAALAPAMAAGDLPAVVRNTVALAEPDSLGRALAVTEGDTVVIGRMVGDGDQAFELEQPVFVDLLVVGAASDARERIHDRMRLAVRTALCAPDADHTLGGVVDDVRVDGPRREELIPLAGLECTQSRIPVTLTFCAPSPLG